MALWKPSRPKDIEEPAVTSAPAPVAPVRSKLPPAQSKALKSGLKALDAPDNEVVDPKNKGFDPYNSGAFNSKDTWSRINRKK